MYLKRIFNLASLVCMTMLIVACSSAPVDAENSPFYNIPVGTSVVLHQALTIPADKAAVFIQNGEVKKFRDIDKYYPHCKFEVSTIKQTNQTIQPDTFIIHKSTTDEQVQVNQSMFRHVALNGGDGPPFIEMYRLMYLRSEQQPDVFRLSCGIWAISPNYYQLTLKEMRHTLGNLITLNEVGK